MVMRNTVSRSVLERVLCNISLFLLLHLFCAGTPGGPFGWALYYARAGRELPSQCGLIAYLLTGQYIIILVFKILLTCILVSSEKGEEIGVFMINQFWITFFFFVLIKWKRIRSFTTVFFLIFFKFRK
jgi:hypothetical protein